MKRVLIGGGWDLMHYNHVLVLKYAKSLGDWLVVNVVSDERMRVKKGDDRPFIPLQQRITILQELRCVDEVISIPGIGYPFYKAIEQSRADIVLINVSERDNIEEEREYCKKHGVELVEIERINDGVSTTQLINKLRAVS